MTKAELNKILTLHQKWLKGNGGTWADLRRADLTEADLTWANLTGADLIGANLNSLYLPPPAWLLLCNWGEVSDKLTIELMRYDANNHPDPQKFDEWAKGGRCPYGKGFQRCANFKEKRGLWKSGRAKSAYELVMMLFKEKDIKLQES